jgi:hypothetical protein
MPTHRNGLMRSGLPGSKSRAEAQSRSLRNMGGPVVSTESRQRGNRRAKQKPLARGTARRADGSEASVPRWYRRAKATKRSGTGGRES